MKNRDIIKNFIVDNFLFGDSSNFDENTNIFEKSIIDSTGILELVLFIEEYYNISISDEELIQENFSSVNTIAQFLQTKLVNA